ncbi:MAG: MFS transporter [Pseudomonadota bacterium]
MSAPRLSGYALFAALLATAGIPIYIHAPKFYVDEYGVGLTSLGMVLFGLRLFDFVQDPALGWLSQRTAHRRKTMVAGAVSILVISMTGLFAVPPLTAPLLWFGMCLTGLFTAFSFLTISFYAQGVVKAIPLGGHGHVHVAAWRETGALLGICVASVAPTALGFTGAPFAVFAAGFAGLALLAYLTMRSEWERRARSLQPAGLREILSDPVCRRLLLIALVNATPVAVTSTLFLFFVESRLNAPGLEGPLLLLFFLAAAASAPAWGRIAMHIGQKRALLAGMGVSVAAFGFATLLIEGDVTAFAIICLASGAALGADMTLLPAIFATKLARVAPDAAQGFGLWSFVSKFTLAFAALVLLPLLETVGFVVGGENAPRALNMLTLLYALVPCVLKLMAIALLASTPLLED